MTTTERVIATLKANLGWFTPTSVIGRMLHADTLTTLREVEAEAKRDALAEAQRKLQGSIRRKAEAVIKRFGDYENVHCFCAKCVELREARATLKATIAPAEGRVTLDEMLTDLSDTPVYPKEDVVTAQFVHACEGPKDKGAFAGVAAKMMQSTDTVGPSGPPGGAALVAKIARLEAERAKYKARVDSLCEPYIDPDGNRWTAPTAWTYRMAVQDRDLAQAQLSVALTRERDMALRYARAAEAQTTREKLVEALAKELLQQLDVGLFSGYLGHDARYLKAARDLRRAIETK